MISLKVHESFLNIEQISKRISRRKALFAREMVLKILRSCEETKCKGRKMEKRKERDKIEMRLYLLAQWPHQQFIGGQ